MHLLHVVRSTDSRRTHYCVDPTRRVLNFTQDTTNEQITTRLSAATIPFVPCPLG